MLFSMETRSGGTGRRAGLKIRWPQGRVGSTPSSGTNLPSKPLRDRMLSAEPTRKVDARSARHNYYMLWTLVGVSFDYSRS